MRMHVLAYPHTETTSAYSVCAYTAKAQKFATMMHRRGHKVYLYGGEENEAECFEHIPVITRDERLKWFGEWDQNQMPNVGWGAADPWWRMFDARVTVALQEDRYQPRDLLLLGTSWAQKPIADQFPELLACEYGVGYTGIALDRCAFESHAWRHFVYAERGIQDGRNFDTVIPNYFDPADFELGDGSGGYLAFLGRVTPRKGVREAIEVSKAAGLPLVVAGPTAAENPVDRVPLDDPNVTYVGPLGPKERSEFLGKAVALLAPTRYIEPFGGVTVEGMMCGTPAVTTDWGAFSENVVEDVSGYRFSTLKQGVDAVRHAAALDRTNVRRFAMNRFSFDAIAPRYEAWFEQLAQLWGTGWYEMPEPTAGLRVVSAGSEAA